MFIPQPLFVCLLVAGVFLCFGISTAFQEYALKELRFPHPIVVTLAISVMPMLLAGLCGGFSGRKASLATHSLVGFLNCFSVGMTNVSFQYLNFPALALFKSCKIIPVMLMGTLVWRKKYGSMQWASALILIVGLAVCTTADRAVTPNFSMLGVMFICMALCADAFIGNVQESLFANGASQLEAMAWPSLVASVISIAVAALTTDLSVIVSDMFARPVAVGCIFVTGAGNAFGLFLVLKLISLVGTAQTTFATSLRKAVSIVASSVLFPKPLTPLHFIGAAVVAAGIYVNGLGQSKKLPAAGGSATSVLQPISNGPDLPEERDSLTAPDSASLAFTKRHVAENVMV